MGKLRFENQFESREQFESVLQKSFPFFIRVMLIACTACAVYELFFLLRLVLGMSSGGPIKHLHYGACYAFMLFMCLWTVVRLLMFRKDTVKHARALYRTQVVVNLGVALWATAITLLDGYYHNEFNVTLFVIVIMILPIISFENPFILGTTHIILIFVVLAAILTYGNTAVAMNFVPIATVLFLLSFYFFNNRKKLYINEYLLEEFKIKELNRELKEKDTLLDEADQEQRMREKQHQVELQRALEEAKSSSEAKSTFLFNMSHDIRTPMNAILGFTRLLEKELDNPEVAKDYLSKIEQSGEYLLSIINDVLDMARIESGKVTLNEDLMHTLSAGTNAVHMSMADIKGKNLTFTHSEDFQHDYVLADEARLNQIFVNILSNAVKYTPEGGSIHVDLKEYPSEKEGYGRFVTEISDTGIGMSEEFQKEIFESFSREKNSTESKVVGTGLGMSIVKRLVDLMGGTIEVESELGRGSTFRLINDFKLADDATIAARSKKAEKEVVDYTGKRILLAEDNDLNAEIAMAILEECGIAVERAEDGVVCLDMLMKAEKGYYDLVLMDIQMPNLNGYEATKRIRQAGNDIPVIAITANAFEEDRQNAIEAGMNGHIAKPIDVPTLFQTLGEVLK